MAQISAAGATVVTVAATTDPKVSLARVAPPGQALTGPGRCASCHSLEKAHHLPQTPECPERRTTVAPWHHHHLLGLSASTHSSRLPPSAPAAFWPEPCSLQVLNGAGSRVGLQTGLPSPSSAAPVPIAFSREFGRHSLSRLLPAAYWAKYLLGALHGDIQGI